MTEATTEATIAKVKSMGVELLGAVFSGLCIGVGFAIGWWLL